MRTWCLFVAATLVLCSCSGDREGPGRRNLILISINSLRPDHLGCYGYGPPTSPKLDALAKRSVVFERAYAPSPWTLPSHVSLFTGLQPATHGVDHGQAQLKESAVTLADLLRARGYATEAVVCAPLLRKRFGLDQGFNVYDTDLVGKSYLEARRMKVADKVTDKALAAVERNRDKPFFLFLHYWDPHYDYNPAREYIDLFDRDYGGRVDGLDIHDRTDLASTMDARDVRHLVALYDAEIRFTDDHLGRLIDGLGKLGRNENTAIIVTADHGEEFLEHGGTGHTHTCFEEVLRIPLIVHVPWLNARPARVESHVSLLDVVPTVLDLLGVSREGLAMQAISLFPALTDPRAVPDRFLLAETRMGRLGGKVGNLSSLLSPDRIKYHHLHATEPRELLFDLDRDPGELDDLAVERGDAARSLGARLGAAHAENQTWNEAIRVGKQDSLEPELSETLKGLGYIQ